MNSLLSLKQAFSDRGCQKIYVKVLSANDNSKNQVYLAGSFDILNILPINQITTEAAGDWNRERFKAALNFAWITEEGDLSPAPQSQLILYPKYPEVRFSGFLARSDNAPSLLMSQRLPGRLLFLSVAEDGTVLGYVSAPDSPITNEFHAFPHDDQHGIFQVIELATAMNSQVRLLQELARIHLLGWIHAKRLDRNGNILSCDAPNCGGYTLEAELGITPNGYSEPDYLGWEIKQFGVANFERINSAIITLMTPEPTGGVYKTLGVHDFLELYGYEDKMGRSDRLNFGGIHKVNIPHASTGLTMKLIGFDEDSGKIRNATGKIALMDSNGNEAATWDFASLLLHWNRKHNQACYVPSLSNVKPVRQYSYGHRVILGMGTDFHLFLKQMALGNIYYDPGIKMENISVKPKIKKRSQFRIKSAFLPHLYKNNTVASLMENSKTS